MLIFVSHQTVMNLYFSAFFLLLIAYVLNHLTYLHETEQSVQRLMGLQQEHKAYINRFVRHNQNDESNSYTLQHLKLTEQKLLLQAPTGRPQRTTM
jgi:hypothetical protein